MRKSAKDTFILSMKLLAIAYGLFLMLFSLDVFGEGPLWEQALGFIIHSLPSIFILAAIAVFWKKPWIMGSVLIAVALFLTVRFRLYVEAGMFLTMSLPPLIAGLGLVIAGRKA